MTVTLLSQRLARIHEGLREAARRRLKSFGASDRNFQLEPVANENDLLAFEQFCGVKLPVEYREFIKTLGDGGAGPGYGLLPLVEGLEYDKEPKTPEILRSPFEFEKYNDAAHLLNPENDSYPPRTGSSTLSTEGCYYRHFIVISGPTYGQMWIDQTTSDGGYFPLNVDFLTWYERWLEDVLAGRNGIWWHQDR